MENLLDNKHVLNETLSGPNPFFADGEIPDSVAQESGLKHRLVFDPRLSEGLGFTKEDLAANRAGEMTDAQKQALFKTRWQAALIKIIAWIFVLGYKGLWDTYDQGTDAPDWWGTAACCLLPMMFVVSMTLLIKDEQAKELSAEKRSGKVESITGAVFAVKGNNTKIQVSNQVLRLPKVTGPIFTKGDRYVIYYVPKSNVIVAAERIDYD